MTTEAGYFVYELAPGSGAAGALRLTNEHEEPIVIDLGAVDAITSTGGGSAFATDDVAPNAVATWIGLDEAQVTLEPGDDLRVPFTIEVPKETEPGQYLAGLSAGVALPAETGATPGAAGADQAGASIVTRTRYVIGVQVNVPGDWTPSLTITGVRLIEQPSGPVIGIDLHNDGGTFLKPTGMFTLTDDQGKIVIEHTIEMGTFVTGTEVVYPVTWNQALGPGTYQARVELEYGERQAVTYENALELQDLSRQTVTIPSLTVEEVRTGTDDTLQFVNVAVTLENPGSAIANARLTLRVTRDGELVEDVVLGEALTLQPGPARFSQRYLPPTGWESGTYAFTVTVEEVNPETENAVELASEESETTVTFP